jgi:hypothetical protein
MKKLLPILLVIPLFGQQTFTEAEVLTIVEDRDAQWKGKIEKADSLISSQKVLITDYEGLVKDLEDQSNLDSLILVAKDSQITLLKARDVANEKMAKLISPKWYENQYLWLGIGFILGKL